MATETLFDYQPKYVTTAPDVQDSTVRRSRFHKGIILLLVITGLMSVFSIQLAKLQIIEGEYNRLWAETNRLRLAPVPAKRGEILDRKGEVLATSRLSRSVYLWPQEKTPEQWQETAKQLSTILKIPDTKIIQQLEQAGYRSRLPVRIYQDINPSMFIALAEEMGKSRGIEIRGESRRYYPHNTLASHLLGYIGEATLDELKANPNYPMGMIVGKTGIENKANSELEGVWGNRLVEVDARGNEIQELGLQSPVSGKPVQLTLDYKLQKIAEEKLGDRRGAAVAIDVRTGAILVMASGPSFNPNFFTRQLTAKEWNRLQGAENPLLNRAMQGYPPGSTFKVVTATAGMQSGKFKPNSKLMTSAAITVGDTSFHEYNNAGYGVIGFEKALTVSSNTFFYQVGMKAGPEQISKWGRELGIGGSINLDILGLDSGNHGQIPTPAEKEQIYGEPWYVGDTVSMSIGQGLVLVTPLELAVMTATVANGGWRVQPHLLASQTNTPETERVKTSISPATLNVIRQGLISVVKEGTGRRLNDGSIPLTGGKTGTVEIPGKPDNSMYIAFGPADKPEIAIAVAVEAGGYGSVSAAPIAHEIFKAYFGPPKPKAPAKKK
ncbi:penicillin-binding protein 2 [Capilliphycus salinus ALCB114379]|uniref:penicillin-binding protein 2 n=1 Tax=Capilliphycus salinus TaxID=2768948 RepID=UPI0039A58CC8